MKKTYYDKKYNFIEIFDDETGFYVRTNVLNSDGTESNIEPFQRSFPNLIDIGIMGHCEHGLAGKCLEGGIRCYQDGFGTVKANMESKEFERLIKQSRGKVQQVALGGRGDVNKHEEFEQILKICRDNGIVPNFTTSGYEMTDDEIDIAKKYVGSIAISEYRQEHTRSAIRRLIDAGVSTNIHYVISKNTIKEAIEKLKNDGFDKGINAVIFLLHKPVGLGTEDEMLRPDSPEVSEFFKLIDEGKYPFKIGFDSCTVPGIINYTKNIVKESIDTCEGARFSMYIDAQSNAYPCSFDNQGKRWALNLNQYTIQEAWDSDEFDNFRKHLKSSCSSCRDRQSCMGGCPIVNITLCTRDEKNLYNHG